ncbi:hypothetical protein SNOG_11064 [Parastagonospora nodorum SN15]|uniref:Uncharacterized protein n=1 Tax=Phaeosphaeria nodorum (strain SN15 / ATCC MYA-4574 / FGSC 10173) TaxID=321614 RepID=Q0UB00_PHANO|nr:hypothetical protein SNOG_11064 [Parastagonospora nodorum SN15]EAT81563.1 hypothetical protein SNOG_11064 [Parastagonospora nodorum SN15]
MEVFAQIAKNIRATGIGSKDKVVGKQVWSRPTSRTSKLYASG